MTTRKGVLLICPPNRPDLPYIAIRFSGYGLHMAGVAKTEQAARAMLAAHEEEAAKGGPKSGTTEER